MLPHKKDINPSPSSKNPQNKTGGGGKTPLILQTSGGGVDYTIFGTNVNATFFAKELEFLLSKPRLTSQDSQDLKTCTMELQGLGYSFKTTNGKLTFHRCAP